MSRNKKILCILLALSMTIIGLAPVSTEAKLQKVKLSNSIIGINAKASVWLPESEPQGASYTYTSSNPSIATVNKKGHITGKKPGNTVIKVTRHYNGKKKALNSVKITVKNAHISTCYKSCVLPTQPGAFDDLYFSPTEETKQRGYFISCGNQKAVYKAYSSNPKKVKASGMTLTYLSGKDGDKVTITIKETYKNKTKSIGSFNVILKKPKLTANSVTWYTGHRYYTGDLVNNHSYFRSYFSEMPLNAQQIKEVGKQGAEFTGDAALVLPYNNADSPKVIDSGTRYFYCYLYNYLTKQYEYIGDYVTIHLVKAPLQSIEIKDSDKPIELTTKGSIQYVNFIPNPHSDKFDLERLSITSSDPNVVDAFLTIAQCLPDHPLSRITLVPHNPGTAIITVEADDVKEEFTVIVKP